MVDTEEQQLYSEFYDFCRKGDAGRAKFYLKAGLLATWTNPRDRDRSLLMATAWKDNEEVCKLLIHSAPINHRDATQMTALHICAKQNSTRVARLLLGRREADPNMTAENGITPLMICADLGHTELGRMLVEHRATKLDLQSSRGFTALMKAVFENSEQLARLLIEKGARLDLASHSGFTALHLCAQLNRRLLAGAMLEVQAKRPHQTDLINLPTKPEFKGNTAFTLAALNGHTEMLQLLRDAGANISLRNSEGLTALDQVKCMGQAVPPGLLKLMESWYKEKDQPEPAEDLSASILARDVAKVKRLVQSGRLATATDPKTGRTPLMLAATLGSPEIVRILLESGRGGGDWVNWQADDCGKATALHAAVMSGSVLCVQLLLDRGAKPGLKDAEGSNLLHLCADLNSSDEIVKLLLDRASAADFQELNNDKRSPAEVAAVRGSVNTLRLLLTHRGDGGLTGNVEALARIRDLAEKEGQFRALDVVKLHMPSARDSDELKISQLFTAAMDRDTQAVESLLTASHPSSVNINAKCNREPGWTALMAAAWNDDEATCGLLLKLGADPNVADTKLGITALHIAVQQDSQRVAGKLLVQPSIDLNVQSRDKRTPLIRAAWLDHRDIGKLLLQKGANVDAQERDGFSALHFCAQENLLEFAKLLVCHEANLELQTESTKNCNTAFTLAAIKGHVEMLELLANVGANIYHRSSRGDAMELAKKARHGKAIEVLRRLDCQQNSTWEQKDSPKKPALLERNSSEAAEICTDATQVQPPQLLPADANLNSSVIPLISGTEYSMNSKPRGICVIINNDEFSGQSLYRAGSTCDVEELSSLFRDTLKFRVQVHRNLDACDIKALMESLASDDRHTKYDCFAAFIMSHGEIGKVFGSDGQPVALEGIFSMFGKCRSLLGKPKLFFLQACRIPTSATSAAAEANIDEVASPAVAGPSVDSGAISRKLDFLFAYATTKGDYALRHPQTGSLYVQTLCRVVAENYRRCHLCTMLNTVRSTLGHQRFTVDTGCGQQVPMFNVPSEETQLRCEVWFRDV